MPLRHRPFRADIVGSLLRPRTIHDARDKRKRDEIDAIELRRIEDNCIREAVRKQKEAGLRVASDGDFHRRHWLMDFLERVDGVEIHGGLPVKFHNEKGDIEYAPPRFEVKGKLKRSRSLAADDFATLAATARAEGLVAKQPIPSPMCVHFRGGSAAVSRDAYPDIEKFFADLAQVYCEEIAALHRAGCRYLQIDDTNLPYLCDPALRENVRKIGEDPDKLPGLYVRMLNDAVTGAPADLRIGVHMCRGNHASSWVAEGGYDAIAEEVFGSMNVDVFLLEFDTPRAGSFAPLRFLSEDKVAVLGLVTTKKGVLETKDALRRRIDEAAKHLPLERLALSPQCGFASTIEGNALSEEEQWEKLRLVTETAREGWGSN